MEAHEADLRSEAKDAAFAAAVKHDGVAAITSATDRALAVFAEKLTREPWRMTPADTDVLRAVGLSDRAIHDAVQVIAYFNYINRVADGLGVDLEPGMPEKPAHQGR